MNGKAISTTIIGSMMVMGGVDATQLNETPLEIQDTIAEEVVEVRQVENVVEATAPWKDQAGLTIKYDMGEPTLTEKFKDERKEQVIYDRVDFGDGGFKVDILLNEKPDTNRFCYQIEGAENYDFFYQPELTPKEIAEGASRPPEIVGSYAVYHKTLKNHVVGQENYATGKVMHIPRPQVWELGNEENKIWADLSYDAGQLCVTVPQDFLDKADYTNGVRIDPTFGYTTIGGTVIASANVHAVKYTSNSDTVNITSISVYADGGGSGNEDISVAIYQESAGAPTNRLATSSSNVGAVVASTPAWSTTSISYTASPSTIYWLSDWMTQNGVAPNRYYDAGSASQRCLTTGTPTYPAFPTPFGACTFTDRAFSIYATYVVVPTVTTNTAAVGSRKAVLYGFTTDSESNTTLTGFVYGLTSDLSGVDTATTTGASKPDFSYTAFGLQPNSTYYYKAFATNSAGNGFGSIESFTTPSERVERINNGTLRINNGTQDL